MFILQVHSLDFPQPISTTVPLTSSAASSHGPNPKPTDDSSNTTPPPTELRGVSHLFRLLPPSTSSTGAPITTTSISDSSSIIFIVAVPNYLSYDDLLLFCGPYIHQFSRIVFLRNDTVEDRYSVLIWLKNQSSLDGFYNSFNGKRYSPAEAEICHIYFLHSVEYYESAELAIDPPRGFTELPTCPVCLERLDQDTSGIQKSLCDHSFQCSCVSKWTYLSCQVCRLCQQQDEKPICSVCGTLKNLWVCLICGFVGCGRYEKGHAIEHWRETQHHYSLELERQQIWDYVGDKYVHRLNPKADGKSVNTHLCCSSMDGECNTCGYNEDPELGGALLSSKFEAITDEYNHLLASQLEIQRQHFESLLAEIRSGKDNCIAKAVEKSIFTRTNDLQSKADQYVEEKKILVKTNEDLTKEQQLLQKRFKEIEERERELLRTRNEKITDLEEQIRDIKIYLGAQQTIANMTDSESIKDGTVLPVELSNCNSSSGNSKRRTKSSRRRN
ncbi:hypothetical protein Leryth_006612 [Lithospermum erythrorhizon]|nr:hypothetical protein Leryth_006612 [Lithospermum erythrorhizon]